MIEILLIGILIGILWFGRKISPKLKVYVGIPLGVLGLTYIWSFSSIDLILQLGFTIVVLFGAYSNYKKFESNRSLNSSNSG
jgi:hypothetical protein